MNMGYLMRFYYLKNRVLFKNISYNIELEQTKNDSLPIIHPFSCIIFLFLVIHF